jgi:hypothetical protein
MGRAVYKTPIPRVEPAIFINDLRFTLSFMMRSYAMFNAFTMDNRQNETVFPKHGKKRKEKNSGWRE